MLSTLITSKARRQILTLFLAHPEEKFYHTQIVRELKLPVSAVQNELKKLTDVGLLTSEREANIRFYKVNTSFPLFEELKSIVYKTTGLADVLKEDLAKLGNVEVAFIYGSVAKNTEDVRSDIDLMVIGKPDFDQLTDTVTKAESQLTREINFNIINQAEWQKKLSQKKGFVPSVYKDKKIFVIGNQDDLRRISQRQSH